MPKTRVCYCGECEKETKHYRIERDSMGVGLGLFRPLLAVMSLGLSESTICAKYECSRCGNVTEESD